MSAPPPLPRWAQPRDTGGVPAPDSALDRQFAAFVGPRWAVYRRKFAPYFEDPRFQPTWNWAAALFSPVWFLYRKLYLPFVFFWMVPQLVFTLLWNGEPPAPGTAPSAEALDSARTVLFGVQLSAMIMAGGTANFLLFRRARAAIHLATLRGATGDAATPLLARVGGVNPRAVLVVLLVFVIAIAVVGGGARG